VKTQIFDYAENRSTNLSEMVLSRSVSKGSFSSVTGP